MRKYCLWQVVDFTVASLSGGTVSECFYDCIIHISDIRVNISNVQFHSLFSSVLLIIGLMKNYAAYWILNHILLTSIIQSRFLSYIRYKFRLFSSSHSSPKIYKSTNWMSHGEKWMTALLPALDYKSYTYTHHTMRLCGLVVTNISEEMAASNFLVPCDIAL